MRLRKRRTAASKAQITMPIHDNKLRPKNPLLSTTCKGTIGAGAAVVPTAAPAVALGTPAFGARAGGKGSISARVGNAAFGFAGIARGAPSEGAGTPGT